MLIRYSRVFSGEGIPIMSIWKRQVIHRPGTGPALRCLVQIGSCFWFCLHIARWCTHWGSFGYHAVTGDTHKSSRRDLATKLPRIRNELLHDFVFSMLSRLQNLFTVCLFKWTPSQRKESGYSIISDLGLSQSWEKNEHSFFPRQVPILTPQLPGMEPSIMR